MLVLPREFPPLKYVTKRKWGRDFRLNVFCFLLLGAAVVAGVAVAMAAGAPFEVEGLGSIAAATMIAGLVLFVIPYWILDLGLIAAVCLLSFRLLGAGAPWLPIILSAGLLVMPAVQLAQQWEKVVIFRLGRFHRLRGPGLFLMVPIIDRAVRVVDTRIRVIEFRHETTLTRDTVPVSVDAIAFWMIWDAEKAILEVEDYMDAVTLAAHAALRNAIGKHDLASLLSEQERLGKEIQEFLDAKTNPWGVSILSIGITDILISKELEDSLSRQAQAERERQSRLILGRAEEEIASAFVEASKHYADNPTALKLRAMSIVYEGLRKNGTIVLLPSGAIEDMALGKVVEDLSHGKAPFQDLAKGEPK
jgi:regulator of protease activity HflC (stomatin/prohibitin superfamily)